MFMKSKTCTELIRSFRYVLSNMFGLFEMTPELIFLLLLFGTRSFQSGLQSQPNRRIKCRRRRSLHRSPPPRIIYIIVACWSGGPDLLEKDQWSVEWAAGGARANGWRHGAWRSDGTLIGDTGWCRGVMALWGFGWVGGNEVLWLAARGWSSRAARAAGIGDVTPSGFMTRARLGEERGRGGWRYEAEYCVTISVQVGTR